MEQVTSDGNVKVQLLWPEVKPDDFYKMTLRFLDPSTDELLDDVKIAYRVAVVQRENLIELYDDEHTDIGYARPSVVFPEDGLGPAEVIVEIVSITTDSGTIQIDEELTFYVVVVPEFEALAMVVLALSFVSLLFLARGKLKIKHSQ